MKFSLPITTPSLLVATLLLTGSLFASDAHKITASQEGLVAVHLLDAALKDSLTEKIKEFKMQEDTQGVSTMSICIAAADSIMKKMNKEIPSYVKMSIASLDSGKTVDTTDLEIMKRYQKDIQNKTDVAMMLSSAKVKDATRVYKPIVVDDVWLSCHDNKYTVKLGDFKGVLISEVSQY